MCQSRRNQSKEKKHISYPDLCFPQEGVRTCPEGGSQSARPGPRLPNNRIPIRRRQRSGPHYPPPSPRGFPPSKANRWGLLPMVANPSSIAQRGGVSPLPVVGACNEKKNTGVRAGIFFPGSRHPCLPAPPPPQRVPISPARWLACPQPYLALSRSYPAFPAFQSYPAFLPHAAALPSRPTAGAEGRIAGSRLYYRRGPALARPRPARAAKPPASGLRQFPLFCAPLRRSPSRRIPGFCPRGAGLFRFSCPRRSPDPPARFRPPARFNRLCQNRPFDFVSISTHPSITLL